jgi:hypothetical protein
MSYLARRAMLVILSSLSVVTAVDAQQPSSDAAATAQSVQPQVQPKQQAETASSSAQSTAASPQPAATNAHSLATVVVNGGPSADILRSARNAGYKIKIANGTTHFCKTEAPIGTRFTSESCVNEEQLTLVLRRAQEQRDQLTHMLGAPAVAH